MKQPDEEFPSKSDYLFPFNAPLAPGEMISGKFYQNGLGEITSVRIVLMDGTIVIPNWDRETIHKFKEWIDELNEYQNCQFEYAISGTLEAEK